MFVLSATTLTTCLGRGLAATRAALQQGRSGLVPCNFEGEALPTWIGEIADIDQHVLPPALQAYDCRNNRLALMTLETDGFADRVRAASARYGADRVGVFVGTSTSGIFQTEQAYRQRDALTQALPGNYQYRGSHSVFSVAEFTRHYFGLRHIAVALSTACSSSAKVFATAARHLALGTIDAAIVGGVDTLCLTTLYGFSSLQLCSSQPCKPYDTQRDGISIGEGAAFALLERADAAAIEDGAIGLLGWGESSDAYHMSAPHPEGLGAQLAMRAALRLAQLQATDIDYINLHGTATPANDAAEGLAVAQVFGDKVWLNSTKGATGHTLGAAGAIEVVICTLALQNAWVPASVGTQNPDASLGLRYALHSFAWPVRIALSNSFGFGGSNCSVILGQLGQADRRATPDVVASMQRAG